MCVAGFYTELRDKEATDAENHRTRSYLTADAVVRPEGFAFPPPPPPYAIAYENPSTVFDKPPLTKKQPPKKIRE